MHTDTPTSSDMGNLEYFPFFFSMIRTIERLEQKHLSVAHFLRGVATYTSRFKPYDQDFQNPNQIPEIFSEDEIDLFIGVQQYIDPKLNSYARRVEINREVGKLGGRPRGSSKSPKEPKKPTGFSKTQWVSNNPMGSVGFSSDNSDSENPNNPMGLKKPNGFSKTQKTHRVSKNPMGPREPNGPNIKENVTYLAPEGSSNSITSDIGEPSFAASLKPRSWAYAVHSSIPKSSKFSFDSLASLMATSLGIPAIPEDNDPAYPPFGDFYHNIAPFASKAADWRSFAVAKLGEAFDHGLFKDFPEPAFVCFDGQNPPAGIPLRDSNDFSSSDGDEDFDLSSAVDSADVPF